MIMRRWKFFDSMKVEQVYDDYWVKYEAHLEIFYSRQRMYLMMGYLSPTVFEERKL